MSASTDPDKAFDWISETRKEGQTLEALRDVDKFTTLDAKLLSALANILTGDCARNVDTYKETEATNKRYVRGRQVLLMMHEHFSTNIKHGATYALQDRFSVKLKGDNLRGFISNWNQVMAGIPKVPEVSVLETLFFNQGKNSKAIAHDLQEYHRAEEGSDKKTYEFLVAAVHRYLDRERLQPNRERAARTSVPPHQALHRLHLQSARRRGTFQRGTVPSGRKARVQMIPAHTNMRSLLPRRIEVSQGHPQTEANHHLEVGMTRTKRNNHASSGTGKVQ